MAMEIKFLGYQTIGDHTEFALQVRAFSPLLPVLWCVMLGHTSQVSCKGTVWSISRRFNDFVDLHSSLRLKRSGADLPAKQWFGRYDKAMRALPLSQASTTAFPGSRQIFWQKGSSNCKIMLVGACTCEDLPCLCA